MQFSQRIFTRIKVEKNSFFLDNLIIFQTDTNVVLNSPIKWLFVHWTQYEKHCIINVHVSSGCGLCDLPKVLISFSLSTTHNQVVPYVNANPLSSSNSIVLYGSNTNQITAIGSEIHMCTKTPWNYSQYMFTFLFCKSVFAKIKFQIHPHMPSIQCCLSAIMTFRAKSSPWLKYWSQTTSLCCWGLQR